MEKLWSFDYGTAKNLIKIYNNRMQSDKLLRYAPQFAADARRYVASEAVK